VCTFDTLHETKGYYSALGTVTYDENG